MSKRTRGLMLPILNIPEQTLLEKLNDKIPHKAWEAGERFTACTPERLAYGSSKDGKHYTIGDEGVGWEFSEEHPLQVEFTDLSWVDSNGNTQHSTFGGGSIVEFTAEEALSFVWASTESVDLADFIRTFGDRLESNFALWHSRLSA